jgi:hypothetical protein
VKGKIGSKIADMVPQEGHYIYRKLLLLLFYFLIGVIIGKTILPIDFLISGVSCSVILTCLHSNLLILILTSNHQR